MARPNRPIRRGVTAVLAMMYLVLFSSLAIGFYAATTASVQIVHNEVVTGRAHLAAETGFDFIRHHLAQVTIAAHTTPNQLFQSVVDQISAAMDGSGNLRGGNIGVTPAEILIPANQNEFVPIDNVGTGFRARIVHEGEKLHVFVVGRDRTSTNPNGDRGISMQFALAQNASNIFDFGVASNGSFYANGNVSIKGAQDPSQGSILATSLVPTPVTLDGNTKVSGDISMANPDGNVSLIGVPSVGGTTDPAIILRDHVHVGVPIPEFPTVQTDPFVAYVTNTYTSGSNHIVNARIPANTNPTINGNVTVRGVLYIEAPNRVRFLGNTNIEGVIVTQNNPTGNLSSNMIEFTGNVTIQGVESLPASFGALRDLTGSFILAPNFHTTFSNNFSTINGSIIAGKITMSGNAGGTILGTIVSLEPNAPFNLSGNTAITISSTGTTNYPAGVKFSSHYAPLADTYTEFKP